MSIGIHQVRHAQATEFRRRFPSKPVRGRLGHVSTETTRLDALRSRPRRQPVKICRRPSCAADNAFAGGFFERIWNLVAVTGTEPLIVDFKGRRQHCRGRRVTNYTTWHARPAGTPIATIDASSPEDLVAAIAEQEATLGTSPTAHG